MAAVSGKPTFCDEHDVIKDLEGFRGRLQQGHHDGRVGQVAHVPQELHNLESGGAVKTCAAAHHQV